MIKKIFLLLTFIGLTMGCDNPSEPKQEKSSPESKLLRITKSPPVKNLTSFRSWSDIQNSGNIKAVKLKWEQELALPRSASTTQLHVKLFEDFAKVNGLKIEWILAESLEDMFSLLSTFQADIIPAHITVLKARQQKASFSRPLMLDKEVLITAALNQHNKSVNPTISIPQGSSYADSAKLHFSDWKIETLTDSLNSEKIADAIASGKIEYSILDKKSFEILAQYRSDIRIVKVLPQTNQLAWAVALNNNTLLNQLNIFIDKHHHTRAWDNNPRTTDLKQLKKDKLGLRMVTRNSPETYFLWRGELMGFEYELAKEFASRQGLRLDVIVADSYDEMIELLTTGKADFVAAGLSRTASRQKQLTFSIRYNRVSEKLVANSKSPPITTYQELEGRKISVRRTSAFWETAQKLAAQYGAEVVAADETVSTEQLIAAVAEQAIDLTIADSNLLSIEQNFRDNITTPLVLNENIPYAYIIRENNPQLLSTLNQFIEKEYRKTFYNVVKNKYLANSKRKTIHREERITVGSQLSPYDKLVKQKTKDYDFDWRLIVAQMYQESRFNPKARSSAGATGLMQVLPNTAREMGYDNLDQPEQSIAAGIQYLDWSRDRFSDGLAYEEKILFALAAYNAGFGHVNDARRLAKQMNWRPDKWFGHVEKAMLLLQSPQYYKKARFGYVRGSEPVNYVREIHQRYLSYLAITN